MQTVFNKMALGVTLEYVVPEMTLSWNDSNKRGEPLSTFQLSQYNMPPCFVTEEMKHEDECYGVKQYRTFFW